MFMLIEVPAPPCIGSKGNWSAIFPSIISSAAVTSELPISSGIRPVSIFVKQAAFFTIAIALIKSGSNFSPVILKFSIALNV